MTDLLLAPHNDDEALFCSFTILRHQPHVHICLRSQVQEDRYGIHHQEREKETDTALWWLGQPPWSQGLVLDTDTDYVDKLVGDFERLDRAHSPEIVWVPAFEEGGHEQHNGVSLVASEVFGYRVRPYLTYRRGSMRTRGREVPFEPSWPLAKMRALCCYRSQIELGNTRPWFMDDTLREFEP